MEVTMESQYEDQIKLLTQRVDMLENLCKLLSERLIRHQDHSQQEIPPPAKTCCPLSDLVKYTPKQHATMQMLTLGKSNKYIASVLEVTESTAKVHVRSVMQKKNCVNRQEVMAEYKITMSACSAEDYLTYSGIPKDWAIHPENYPTHTKKLRESYHVKIGETS